MLFGMNAAERKTTMIKMTIGVTIKNIVGRLLIRPEQRVGRRGEFWLLLPVDISAGYESPTTSASVRS